MFLRFWKDREKEKSPNESWKVLAAGSRFHQSFRFFQFARTTCTAKSFALQVASQYLTSLNANNSHGSKVLGTDPAPWAKGTAEGPSG